MRRLKITHLTEYQFFSTVTLLPHRLLLRPREGPEVHIESSSLTISPADHRVKWHRDAQDNAAAAVDFQEPTQFLSISSEVVIQHYVENPFDFLFEDYAVDYPFHYVPMDRVDLGPFLQPVYPGDEKAIRNWLNLMGLMQPVMQTYALLDQINKAIAGRFTCFSREEPGVQTPGQTLSWGRDPVATLPPCSSRPVATWGWHVALSAAMPTLRRHSIGLRRPMPGPRYISLGPVGKGSIRPTVILLAAGIFPSPYPGIPKPSPRSREVLSVQLEPPQN